MLLTGNFKLKLKLKKTHAHRQIHTPYLATCEQASTRTDSKSLVNSGPFFLLFWMTSLARYRKVSFLVLLAGRHKNILKVISYTNAH